MCLLGVMVCASLFSDRGSEPRMYFVLQVIRKGEVSCCWICTACKENEFVQDEFTCKACELGWWPNADLTGRHVSLQTRCFPAGHEESAVRWTVRLQRAETLKVHIWTHVPLQFRVTVFQLSATAETIKTAKFLPKRNVIVCLFLSFI